MNIILHIIFLTFLNFVFSQTNSDSLIIKNKIKEVRIFDIDNNIACITKYDSLGKLTYNLMDNFTSQTSLKSSLTKIYNEKGNPIKTIFTHSSYSKPTIWINEFDDRNNKITTKDDLGNLVFEYFYDNSNFLVKKISYDEETKQIRNIETIEKTNEGKTIISKITKDSINRINTKHLDNRGNIIKSDSYDGETLNSSIISSYDENNRISKIIYKSNYGSNYIYNTNNQLIKRQSFKITNDLEIFTNFEEFEYNELGLIHKYRENKYSKNLREYYYEYDFYK